MASCSGEFTPTRTSRIQDINLFKKVSITALGSISTPLTSWSTTLRRMNRTGWTTITQWSVSKLRKCSTPNRWEKVSIFRRLVNHRTDLYSLSGSLTECLSFDIKISSTIPVLFGLPRLSKNQIEGVIIKCTEPLTLPGKGRERAIFKHKNDKVSPVLFVFNSKLIMA